MGVEAERCVQVFDGHSDGLYDVALDPTGQRALSGSRDTTVRLWDLESGRCLHVLEGHAVGVLNAVWSADDRRIYSCDWNGGIRSWEVPARAALRL